MKGIRLLIALAWSGASALACGQTAQDQEARDKATLHPYDLRIAQSVAEKMLVHRVEPEYPEEIKASGISGEVYVRYVIDKQGNTLGVFVTDPTELIKSSANPQVHEAVVKAVRLWKFKPYLLNGEPVEVETMARFSFNFAPARAPDTSPARPQWVRVSAGVANANLIHVVEPAYPLEAKAKRIKGTVILKARIDVTGTVSELTPEAGHPVLVDEAMRVVKQWKYRPFLLNRAPVGVETIIKIRFDM